MESFTVRKVFYFFVPRGGKARVAVSFKKAERDKESIQKSKNSTPSSFAATTTTLARPSHLLCLSFFFPTFSHEKNQPLPDDDASLLRARVAALEAELQGMRLSSLMMTATASAAQPPLSPHPPPPFPVLRRTAASAAAAASAADSASAASAAAAASSSHDDDDQPTALVPRAALELLKLKDQAMDSVLEGITIADARRPDMPLIYVGFFPRFFSPFFSSFFRRTKNKNKNSPPLLYPPPPTPPTPGKHSPITKKTKKRSTAPLPASLATL